MAESFAAYGTERERLTRSLFHPCQTRLLLVVVFFLILGGATVVVDVALVQRSTQSASSAGAVQLAGKPVMASSH
jgi:hypothetical protein